MNGISWDELLYFIEDVFQCEMQALNLNWNPIRTLQSIRKFFTAAIGFSILETNKYLIEHPSEEHLEFLMAQLLSSSNACQDYIFLIGQRYFNGEEFSWQIFRNFLAFMGEVAAYAVSQGRVLLIDDIVLSTALYIKDYLMWWIEGFGGWVAFQVDCVRCVLHQTLLNQFFENENSTSPSAPSELPCDPLLSNEHQMGRSNPPPRYHRPAPKPPAVVNVQSEVRVNRESNMVRVLPSQYAPAHKLRPVFSTFTTEEPA